MDNLQKRFAEVRKNALYFIWLNGTGRNLLEFKDIRLKGFVFDNFDASYECRWQDSARRLTGSDDWHVSYFCSLGDWASNITDLLSDTRYDSLSLLGEESEKGILFRYYTRLLLIISEMITDFADILEKAKLGGKSRDRLSKYMTSEINIHTLIGFLNHVCKHKAKDKDHIHYHNHHLPIWFEDSEIPCPYKSPYSYENYHDSHMPDSILMPRLGDMVQVVIDCYEALDTEFNLQGIKFEQFCKLYGRQVPD